MSTITSNEPGFISLHDEYQNAHACGIDADVSMFSVSAQSLAAKMRGIEAITAVLMAESFEGEVDSGVTLSNWLRHGLIEAAHALTADMRAEFDDHVHRANREAMERQKVGRDG